MTTTNNDIRGAQRHSLERLHRWEALQFGMFIHFGMSTFVGEELPDGTHPSTLYAPDKLDVDQWVSVARDAGMKYAVLTTKHVSGHCLWPSKHTDYHVGTSGNKTDVVEAFVNACDKRGVLPGFYYCSWDNHHRFGSLTPTEAGPYEQQIMSDPAFNFSSPIGDVFLSYTTREYQDFQTAQVEELLTRYGKIAEVWIDVPQMNPRCYRQSLYRRIAELQPDSVIMFNTGIGDGTRYRVPLVWPSDLVAIERCVPNSLGHRPWRQIEGKQYYLPGEVCDPVGKDWFFTPDDQPRSDGELLGMYLLSVTRGANLLLDVGPDRHGRIPDAFVAALQRLRANIDKSGLA